MKDVFVKLVEMPEIFSEYISHYSSYYLFWAGLELVGFFILLTVLIFSGIMGVRLIQDMNEIEDVYAKESMRDTIKFFGYRFFLPGVFVLIGLLYFSFFDLMKALYPLIQFG